MVALPFQDISSSLGELYWGANSETVHKCGRFFCVGVHKEANEINQWIVVAI